MTPETESMDELRRKQRAAFGAKPPVIEAQAETRPAVVPELEAAPDPDPPAPAIDQSKVAKQVKAAATKEVNRQAKESAKNDPNAFKNPVASGRERMANFVPDGTHIEVWKRIPDTGKLGYVADYVERDLRGHRSVHHFIASVLYPKHRVTEWEVVFVKDDGSERRPVTYIIDPDAEGVQRMDSNSAVVTKLLDKLDRLGQPQPQEDPVERIQKVLAAFGPTDEMDGMSRAMMMKFIFEPPRPTVDPEVVALRAEVQRLLAMPPPMPPPPPPVADPNALTVRDLMAWQEKADARMVSLIDKIHSSTEKQIEAVRSEIKEANKPAPKRDLESILAEQRTLLQFAKEVTKKDEGEGNVFAEFVGNVSGLIKELRTQDASKQPALPPGAPAPQPASSPIMFPEGFPAEVAKINTAADDVARIEATLNAWGFLVNSGQEIWRAYHAELLKACKAGEKVKVREFLTSVLDELKQRGWLKPEIRDTTLQAFDAKLDTVMATLAKGA